MSISAVTTTGIYCRPDCTASPLPQNVRPYHSAAAAEAAGFRACLRCRPYRSERPVSWEGPELVCRGVQLVLDGVLDRGTEADLGARLGVSPRHLRRLFVEHAGVTPDQLARSRRMHFARRLLDDTDLSVTDIAFASGFGSVRQLNRAAADIFRATPSELRARRRRSDRLVADGGLPLRLPFAGPLDWPALLGYFRARAIPGVEHVDDSGGGTGGVYRRTIVVDGDVGVLEVHRPAPDADRREADHLLLQAHLPHWEGLIHVVQRARRIFALDADVRAANDALAGDPLLGPAIEERPGLRMPGAWDAFEVGVRAIVGQQVSVKGATTVTGRIVERHGRPVPGLDALGLTHAFPTADALVDADLDGLGLTTRRAEAIRAFARAVAGGEVVLDRSVPLTALVESVTAVPGLGRWTAEYLALRLGEPDACPTTDLGLRRGAAILAGHPGEVPASIDELAVHWSPWRAHASIHLWHA